MLDRFAEFCLSCDTVELLNVAGNPGYKAPHSQTLQECLQQLETRRASIRAFIPVVQGLRDNNIETSLIVYKGFGHGISKPKEQLAATWHNWQWFGRYIWGEEYELPLDLEEEQSEEEVTTESN